MSLLEVTHLRKTFDRSVVAVDDLSFHVQANEVVGLVGPNGAGKTTTMSMLAGLLQPDSGSIAIDGHPFDSCNGDHRAIIGMAPQDLAVYPDLTTAENLSFFCRMYGIRGARVGRRVAAVLELTGLAEHACRLVKTLSGGMKRRLNFGVALLHEPRLVILDEPTVGVDTQSRSHLLDAVRQLSRDGVGVVYASHYMEEVEEVCDRVGIMDHGRLLACDSLDQLMSCAPKELRLCIEPSSARLIELLRGRVDVQPSANADLVVKLLINGHDAHVRLNDQLWQVTEAIRACGAELRSVESEEHTLERLFLKLTGDRLRD